MPVAKRLLHKKSCWQIHVGVAKKLLRRTGSINILKSTQPNSTTRAHKPARNPMQHMERSLLRYIQTSNATTGMHRSVALLVTSIMATPHTAIRHHATPLKIA
mmetsp:Transcript_51890/g.143686  ORF Transcript_51890/g.143686 Transcript_51890/m.143686 type:complete len:103 (-) Transcript_51890:13-321(-)